MDRLQKKLNETYSNHFQRVNTSLEITGMMLKWNLARDIMYGDYLRLLPENSKILDLGCGVGFLLHWLGNYQNIVPVGVDSSQMQVDIARKNLPDMTITCEDGYAFLKQHPNTFEGIFCTDVVEHIPDDALLDWFEVIIYSLKPGGFFTCRVPNAANLFASYSRYMDMTHQRIYTATSLLQLLEVSGLTDCKVIQIEAGHFSGKARLNLEWLLHKILFRVTGRGLENVFTSNVNAIGFKKMAL